jgi:hypothetical protein
MELIAKHIPSGYEKTFPNVREMMDYLEPIKEAWVFFYRYSNGFETEPKPV